MQLCSQHYVVSIDVFSHLKKPVIDTVTHLKFPSVLLSKLTAKSRRSKELQMPIHSVFGMAGRRQ